MTPSVALQLGRVSNLPTVWSNVLVGTVLAGASPWTWSTLFVALAVSLLYVGGMYLNDAFDREIDAVERPGRPIPSGLVSANTVFAAGFALLLGGIALVALLGQPSGGSKAVIAATALAGAIVFYDYHHKENALSPFFMGLCRVLAYLTAGYVAADWPGGILFVASLVSLSYLIGLTYTAKQEALDELGRLWPLLFLGAPLLYALTHFSFSFGWGFLLFLALAGWILVALFFLKRREKGDVPRAVVSLIAGISLVDALILALAGAAGAAFAAVLCFLLTLFLQRWISGT
jgi:4-hydroxybenzoate polyprenyltransferase